MIIKRSREHLVNLQNYESVRVGATVELNIDGTGEAFAKGVAAVDNILDQLLAADLEEAEANVPDGKETHLSTWKK